MEPTDGCKRKRSQCHCFQDCAEITDKEFHKIFELEDAGVALYRYVPRNQDPDETIGDVYILRTNDDVEMEPDEFTMAFAKNKISCPRCIKLIEKAEKLLTGRPLIKKKELAGVCDHCWKPLLRMQKLSQLAKKKEKVSTEEAVEALKAQIEQTNEIVEDETKEPKGLKERPTTPRTRAQRKDLKSAAKDDKPEAKEKNHKTKETKDEKPAANEKKVKVKDEKSQAKEKASREKTSSDQLKAQIAQEKLKREREKQEADNRKKQQEQEKKLAELAEKKAKEADLDRQKLGPAKSPPKLVIPVTDSEDDAVHPGDVVYKAPVVNEIIIGEKICKNTRVDKGEDLDMIGKTSKLMNSGKVPAVTTKTQEKGPASESLRKVAAVESETAAKAPEKHEHSSKKLPVNSEIHVEKKNKEDGTIRYSLSDRTFIDKGWTMLPLEKVVRKMNVYRMRPSKPEFDWFEHNKNKVLAYDTGERLAEVDGAGRGRWYYRNGELAMDYYNAEEANAGQRFVVYSSGAPDERGRQHPRTVLATFDHSGNGIVFDHAGKPRLKYNQTEGIVLDREIGPVCRWKWHTLNDPPVLQQVMIDTELGHKDPEIARLGPEEEPRQDDEAMLSIELDNFVKEKTKKSSQNFKPFQIKMKALKINENFSLRVLDQASVYLSYKDGSTNLKINIGMLLDHKEIVDTDTSEIGEVSNRMEKLPAYTASISELQKSVARARARAADERAARARLAGCPEGRLSDIDSVDALRAAISRPPRTPLFTCSASATHDTPKLLKPCSCDLYCKPRS